MNNNCSSVSFSGSRLLMVAALSFFVINSTQAQEQTSPILYQGNGVIMYTGGKKGNVQLTTSGTDSSAILYRNTIYFIEKNAANATETSIVAWDVRKKERKVLVATGTTTSDGNVIKDQMVKLMTDKKTNRLFFSTYVTRNSEYLTWNIDLATGQVSSFKDGIITAIDDAGSVTVVFFNKDYIGAYTQQAVYSANGVLINMQEKKY